MSQAITISSQEVMEQVKLSCQIPAIVENILRRKIIEQKAEKESVKIEINELQQAADKFRAEKELWSSQETHSWLTKYNLSVDDFEQLVQERLISNKLAQHLFASKVEPFFAEHQLDYAQVVMYEVILDDFDFAIELFFAIKEEEISFSEVAHQYIEDQELSRRGGYRGVVNRHELKPEISAAVFAANPPEVLKPIMVGKKVHLILIEEVIQPQLNEKLRTTIVQDLFSRWLEQEVEQAQTLASVTLVN